MSKHPGTAAISSCGIYRYELTRTLDCEQRYPPLVVCGLNPSTATAEEDDRTIDRETDFASRWMCGELVKVNVYAFRSTDPVKMFEYRAGGGDIVGPENDAFIQRAADRCVARKGVFLVAWGANMQFDLEREVAVERLLIARGVTPMALKVTKGGHPNHPLYLKKTLTPVPWRSGRA